MRVRAAWLVILAVNVLWAAAFFGYTHRSRQPVLHGGEIVRPAVPARVAAAAPARPVAPVAQTATNAPAAGKPATNAPATAASAPAFLPAGREFGWQDVTNDLYTNYIVRLRAAGCPAKQVRSIVIADVNELLDKRRLDYAVSNDIPWWRADNMLGIVIIQARTVNGNFDQERRDLFDKLLGQGWEDTVKLPALTPSSAQLTGPVLGALPSDTWNSVQEVCATSMERHQAFIAAHANEGVQQESPEMAKLRDFTRTELAKILSPEQLEEFLLRNSHNATKLRQDMRGFDITPDEFRKIFRAVDPIEHQIQLDYGGVSALSEKQREQYEAQKDRAVREALPPQRYEQYARLKDPQYQAALATATQYGLSPRAIQPIFDLQRLMDTRRTQISQNAGLTPEQKAQALQSVTVEQQQALQKMMMDQANRQ